jgi:hypothetical protein
MSDADTPYIEMLEAKVCRLGGELQKKDEAIKALVEAGDRLDDAITSRNIHRAILDGWAEAKRKAGL